MERSRKIFDEIATGSRRVVTAANEYADGKDVKGVPRHHFQLEEDMRRVAIACERLSGGLGKTSSPQTEPGGTAVDVRIQDWLGREEPKRCLETLRWMETLLGQKAPDPDALSSWMSWIFQSGWGMMIARDTASDKIEEAVNLFGACRGYFRFLYSTETWNDESGSQRQTVASQSRDRVIQEQSIVVAGQSQSTSLQTKTCVSVPRPAIQQEYVDLFAQERTSFLNEALGPTGAQAQPASGSASGAWRQQTIEKEKQAAAGTPVAMSSPVTLRIALQERRKDADKLRTASEKEKKLQEKKLRRAYEAQKEEERRQRERAEAAAREAEERLRAEAERLAAEEAEAACRRQEEERLAKQRLLRGREWAAIIKEARKKAQREQEAEEHARARAQAKMAGTPESSWWRTQAQAPVTSGPPKIFTSLGGWRQRMADKEKRAAAGIVTTMPSPVTPNTASPENEWDVDWSGTVPEKKVWRPKRLRVQNQP